MIKAFLKSIIFSIFFLILVYVLIFFIEGGFAKKLAIVLPVKNPGSVLLFAHRGVVSKYPENSYEAIGQAKLKKFIGLEIDIRKSADSEFILFHDENGKRLLGLEEEVRNMTIAQLKEHKLFFNNDTSQSKVLTLNEMLDEYKGYFIIYFDMKLKGIKDIDELVHLIWSYEISRTVILASTNPLVIFYVEHNYPAIQTALEGFNAGKEWIFYMIPKNLQPDYYSSFADKVSEKHVEWLREKDLLSSRIVYGVDSTNYQSMVDLGLKNMIIDYFPSLQVP